MKTWNCYYTSTKIEHWTVTLDKINKRKWKKKSLKWKKEKKERKNSCKDVLSMRIELYKNY